MSENQKLVTSITGTVVGHLLLLVLLGLLLFSDRSTRAGADQAAPDQPREVTIALQELIEHLEVEEIPPEPLPVDQPDDPSLESRLFVDSDHLDAADQAPENARFESDRSTVVATRLLPDPDRPREEGPTLDGAQSLPHLQLQQREYFEGELQQPPSAAPPPAASVAEASASVPPSMRPGADARDYLERFYALPSEFGEELPEEEQVAGLPAWDNFSADRGSTLLRLPDTEDSEKDPEQQAEIAESSDLEMEQLSDDSEFGEGFSPIERESAVNGTLSNLGESAVDAVETPLGRYKKAVKDAVAQQWHRYRSEHADSVAAGVLKLTFRVDAQGRVKGLKATEGDSDQVLTEFSLQAVRDAEIPPMPEEVSELLGTEGLELKYDIIIY